MAVNTVPHQLDVVNPHPPTWVLPLRRLTIYHLPDIHTLIDPLRAPAILLCPIADEGEPGDGSGPCGKPTAEGAAPRPRGRTASSRHGRPASRMSR